MKTFPIPYYDQTPIYEIGTGIATKNVAGMIFSFCSCFVAVIVQCVNVQFFEEMLQANVMMVEQQMIRRKGV